MDFKWISIAQANTKLVEDHMLPMITVEDKLSGTIVC